MKTIIVVFGTRPEAIKVAPVIKELQRYPEHFALVKCITSQHRQMLDQVLATFGVEVDHDLGVMEANQSLASITAKVVTKLSRLLIEVQPDFVLVQGDTTSAMAAALAAFYHKVPVGHIEAGLRTGGRYYPFPEEVNRRLISTLATLHFAPTNTAVEALLSEGIPPQYVFQTGNTVIDALQMIVRRPAPNDIPSVPAGQRMILVTAHRRENFGAPLESVCEALLELVSKHEDIEVVYPVHLNPNVQGVVRRLLGHKPRIHLLDPVDYPRLVHLLDRCYLVLTDSGGIQEEAPALGKPVLVLRDETERPEGVAAGTAILVGPHRDRIVAETTRLLEDTAAYGRMAKAHSPYGDGHAAQRIVDALFAFFAEEAALVST